MALCLGAGLNLGKHCVFAWPQTSNFGQNTSSLKSSSAAGPPKHSAGYILQTINSCDGNQVSPVSLKLNQTYNAVSMPNNASLEGAVTASSNACIGEECDCSLSFPTDP